MPIQAFRPERFRTYGMLMDLEQLTAQRPSRGLGKAARFSTRLMPSMMRIAYGPVQVKAWVVIRMFTQSSKTTLPTR